jgi:hypothetical protein
MYTNVYFSKCTLLSTQGVVAHIFNSILYLAIAFTCTVISVTTFIIDDFAAGCARVLYREMKIWDLDKACPAQSDQRHT